MICTKPIVVQYNNQQLYLYFMKAIFQKLTLCLAVAGLLFVKNGLTQSGCTDPQALNYDDQATENDGSCTYPNTEYLPMQIALLPASLTECSGLAFFNDQLWTNLDNGNPDKLYEIDTLTGALNKTVTIPSADNEDWEDLAEDEEHIYIGDFGNNPGNRTDLRIYKIKKEDLLNGIPSPELIEFSFSDQTDFTQAHNSNNYDCEAFFYWQDSLHLFSKNWLDFKTRHYVLPASPGTHIAELRDSLFAQGQITAADISEEGVVLLLGYNKSTAIPFMWLLFDYTGNSFFSGNKRLISLVNPVHTSQVEGIVFRGATKGYICSEKFEILPPRLLSFDIAELLQGPVAIKEPENDFDIDIFPNPAKNRITINFEKIAAPPFYFEVLDLSGKKILDRYFEKNNYHKEFDINIAHIPVGAYWLRADIGNKMVTRLFYKE